MLKYKRLESQAFGSKTTKEPKHGYLTYNYIKVGHFLPKGVPALQTQHLWLYMSKGLSI
jgi:hypothetical protein